MCIRDSLLIAEELMRRRPRDQEGSLSKARAGLVNTRALASRAKMLGLDQAMRLGRGEERSGGRTKPSILANVFEAVLGALYQDAGLDACRRLVERVFEDTIDRVSDVDAKTRLQEVLQQSGREAPRYEMLESTGPDHAREFEVGVYIAGDLITRARGASKRAAEQAAAQRALDVLVPEP